jgi:UDP-glucose 4-epimerase
VFHLAAAVGPALVAGDPVGTWSRNVIGTATVLDACARTGARVLIASSSEVYDAIADSGPLREDQALPVDPHGRRDVYAVSKLAGECYAQALHRSKLLPVTIVRPFSIVGPRQSARYGMVLARFVEAALAGQPLPIYGDGSQARCFLHVHDAVKALLALIPVAAAEGAVVNLGNDRPVTIRALADRVLALSGAGGGTIHVPFANVYGEGFLDPPCRQPDLSRLKALTDWRPTRDVDAMIGDALAVARGAASTLPAGRRLP